MVKQTKGIVPLTRTHSAVPTDDLCQLRCKYDKTLTVYSTKHLNMVVIYKRRVVYYTYFYTEVLHNSAKCSLILFFVPHSGGKLPSTGRQMKYLRRPTNLTYFRIFS